MASVKVTKRQMRRKKKSGEVVILTRYVLNYRDPKSGQRVQKFFERQKEAQDAQSQLLLDIKEGPYANQRDVPTVEQAFDHWLDDRRGQIKPTTIGGYEAHRPYIVGPLLTGTKNQRFQCALTGQIPKGCEFREMLGSIKVTDLTTAEIRTWHKLVADSVGPYAARRAKGYLQTILALAAEDYAVRPPHMPKRLGRGAGKPKKAILTSGQVKALLDYARKDRDYGAFMAFPFLTGVRPSEQLGLLWEDVDFEEKAIHIRRMQERDGSITNFTKTVAGTRTIPLSTLLYEILSDWKTRCPKQEGKPYRVFPNLGFLSQWPKPRRGGGNFLCYNNFRHRVWRNALKKAGVPYVTPHSARHFFISTLQAQGVEIGLVAQLAGHANITVTLNHYTQATRGGEDAMEGLSKIFQPGAVADVPAPAAG